jgi:drug/metabolite transporter (DMT)-like permease
MTFLAILIVVFAALLHASWNLMVKHAASAGSNFVFSYSVANSIFTAPWALWELAHTSQPWTLAIVMCLAFSTVLNFAYSLCLQRGYQIADLSVVYPVARGTGPTLASIGALIVLGETPKFHALLGLAAVVAGIGLIATQGKLAAFQKHGGARGVRWGLAIGTFIAAYSVNDAWGVKTLGITPVLFVWFPNIIRACLLAPSALKDTTKLKIRMQGYWLYALGVGVLSPISYVLILIVLRMGAPLSIVAPMREMSMMIAAILGMIILREQVNGWRLLGCATLIAGVIILGLA